MLNIEIPENIVQAIKLPDKEVKKRLLKILAAKLYEERILGIGKARELAGVSKIEFYSLLKEENICLNYDEEELELDLAQIKDWKK